MEHKSGAAPAAGVQTVVFRVRSVASGAGGSAEDGGALDVTLEPVLDRHRLPLDPDKAGVLTVSVHTLFDALRAYVPEADAEIAAIRSAISERCTLSFFSLFAFSLALTCLCECGRVLDVVYQVFGDDTMSPISTLPQIKFRSVFLRL
jgi:hypothetical protein